MPVVNLVPAESDTQYNELVAANGGCFFQRHDWLSTMAAVLGLRFLPRIVTVDGAAVGIAPVLAKRLGPCHTVNWLPFPYVGPLVPDAVLPATLHALRRLEGRLRTLRSQQVLLAPVSAHPGYTEHRDRTFVLDFAGRDEDALRSAMTSRRRGQLRRAVAEGVAVRTATEREISTLLPAWSAATFAAQGLPAPYSAAAFATVLAKFGHCGQARFSTALVAGEPVCAQVSFAGAPRAVAWAMAGVPDQRSSLGVALLYWDTMAWALRQGCTQFDLVGAPTEGVARYKREWGATEQHYSVLRHQSPVHSAALRLAGRLRPRPGADRAAPARTT